VRDVFAAVEKPGQAQLVAFAVGRESGHGVETWRGGEEEEGLSLLRGQTEVNFGREYSYISSFYTSIYDEEGLNATGEPEGRNPSTNGLPTGLLALKADDIKPNGVAAAASSTGTGVSVESEASSVVVAVSVASGSSPAGPSMS